MAAKRIIDSYAPLQGAEGAQALRPFQEKVRNARPDKQRPHAQSDLDAMNDMFNIAQANVLGLPNYSLDPAMLPISIEPGRLSALLEGYPGHSGTDIMVRVPEHNVVYTGNLLFRGNIGSGSI